MIFNEKDEIFRCPKCSNPYFTVSEEYVLPNDKNRFFLGVTNELNFVEKNIIISCSDCKTKICSIKTTNSIQ